MSSFSNEKYTYISKTHYKSLISILSTCKYVTSSHDTCLLSSMKNISENSGSMPHQLMPCHLSTLENNSKNFKKLPHATSPFSIEK
jgi:hypothetical protein